MPQSLLDEKFVADLLIAYGLQPVRFSTDEMILYGKTPDFKVLSPNNLQFYCEVKSIMEDEVYDNDHVVKVHRRIFHKIQEASAQFRSVNFQSAVPNVLALVNHEPFATLGDLVWALEDIQPLNPLPNPIYGHHLANRLLGGHGPVDLFIWVNRDSTHQLLLAADSPYYSCLVGLLGLNQDKIEAL
ncbi:MAG TPA: hypothetical protein VN426_09985 [Syntrophomonadaceae bacterium]|nr:hypothetical protein [Syntrophomonadaceae bacterium]